MSKPNELDLSGKTDELLPVVYEELRRIAAAQMATEKSGHTLQATGLVHEAYMRLMGDAKWENRGHFFAAAAQAMRRILIDHARRKQSIRQGGDREKLPLMDDDIVQAPDGEQLLELHDALTLLAETQPEAAKLVELRVFTGLTMVEAAEILEVPERTARRTWQYARAWLRRTIAAKQR